MHSWPTLLFLNFLDISRLHHSSVSFLNCLKPPKKFPVCSLKKNLCVTEPMPFRLLCFSGLCLVGVLRPPPLCSLLLLPLGKASFLAPSPAPTGRMLSAENPAGISWTRTGRWACAAQEAGLVRVDGADRWSLCSVWDPGQSGTMTPVVLELLSQGDASVPAGQAVSIHSGTSDVWQWIFIL